MSPAQRVPPSIVRGAVLAAVIALALGTRIHSAGTAGGVWRDEANDLFLCRNNPTPGGLLRALDAEGSPSLRFLVECAVERWSSGSLTAQRAVVITFGTLAVAVATLVAVQVFGPMAGLIAGTLGATSPFLIRFSVELRGYAQYQLVSALYALALVAFVQRRTMGRALIAGAAAATVILTHYAGLFLVGATLVWLAVVETRTRRDANHLLAIGVLTMALVAPGLPTFMSQTAGDLRGWMVPDRKGLDLVRVASLALGVWGVAIGAAACAWRAWWLPYDRTWMLLLAGAVGANVVAWVAQFLPPLEARLEPWYLAGMVIWLLPPLGAAFADLSARVRPRVAAVAAASLVVAWSQGLDAANWLKPRSPIPDIARIVEREGRLGDLVVILPAAHASTFNFYYQGTLDQWAPPLRGRVTNVPWRDLARALDDDRVGADLTAEIARRLHSGGRIWLVNGGGPVDRTVPDASDGPTTYVRGTLRIQHEVVRALYASGDGVRLAGIPALDYWEPAELLLFTRAK